MDKAFINGILNNYVAAKDRQGIEVTREERVTAGLAIGAVHLNLHPLLLRVLSYLPDNELIAEIEGIRDNFDPATCTLLNGFVPKMREA